MHEGARRPAKRDERGSEALELALVSPLLLLIVLGIVEFGWVFSNYLGVRTGVRQAARQGAISIGAFNNAAPTCTLTGVSGASNDVEDLMCLAQSQVGLGDVSRIKVVFDNPALTAGGSTYAVGNAIVVCQSYPLTSITKMFALILDGRYITDKAAFRIEAAPSDGETETAGAETDPSGGGWSWCQD